MSVPARRAYEQVLDRTIARASAVTPKRDDFSDAMSMLGAIERHDAALVLFLDIERRAPGLAKVEGGSTSTSSPQLVTMSAPWRTPTSTETFAFRSTGTRQASRGNANTARTGYRMVVTCNASPNRMNSCSRCSGPTGSSETHERSTSSYCSGSTIRAPEPRCASRILTAHLTRSEAS